MSKSVPSKIHSIEFMRAIFCLTVIFYHVTMGSIIPYTDGNAFYRWCSSAFSNSGFVVEAFFIISGYFLMASIKKRPQMKVIQFFAQKICRLWPLFLVSTIFTHFMTHGIWGDTIINSMFLQMTGLTFSFRGINWYVSAMFWSLAFYFILSKCISVRYCRCFVVLLVSWASYAINLQTHPPMGFGREVVLGFLSLGLLRGLAGVGLGILINEFVEEVGPHFKGRVDWRVTFLLTGVELIALTLLILHLYFRGLTCKSHFIIVVAFAALLPIFALRAGLISRLLDRRWLGVLGKYTYSMYVMQQVGFWILQKTLWLNTAFITKHIGVTLIVSVVVPAAVGVAAYYLIELPGRRMLFAIGNLLHNDRIEKENENEW